MAAPVKFPFLPERKPAGKHRAIEARADSNQWAFSWMNGLVQGGSYQAVDPVPGENSLQSVAFHGACDLLASIVSELPFDVYRDNGDDLPIRINTPGYLQDPAGDGYGVEDWIYQLCMSWFLRGNAYGNILDQAASGFYRQVDLWHPDSVGVFLNEDTGQPEWRIQGSPISNSRMLHRRAFPIAGVLLGLSPVQSHAKALGLNLTATTFGYQWFSDGGHPSGILSNSEVDMNQTVATKAKKAFLSALYGTREPVVLGRGWKFDQIQVNPEESQFLETQNYSAAECCRILGPGVAEVFGYDTGGSMTYANVVDRDLALLKYSANRWVRRTERLLSQFLPRPQYVKFNRDAFLETNALDRWRKHAQALTVNAMTINEVRHIERLAPVAWGNEPFTAAPPTPEPAPEPGPSEGNDTNAD